MNVILFNRDFRLHDHKPLFEALQHGEVLPLYIVEPSFWKENDVSTRHFQFVLESLEDLSIQLVRRSGKLFTFIGEMEEALEILLKTYGAFRLFFYEDFGTKERVNRNERVRRWMDENKLPVTNFLPQAYFIDVENSRQYKKRWQDFIHEEMIELPTIIKTPSHAPADFQTDLSELYTFKVHGEKIRFGLKGGETIALETLESFLENIQDSRTITEELLDVTRFSSKLSPYITWGNLSIRYVVQKIEEIDGKDLQPIVQKLYQRCLISCFYEEETSTSFEQNQDVINKWLKGMTGIPIIDAIMRYIDKTGWIHHEARLASVSFIRDLAGVTPQEFGPKLAQLFIDYEPSIHYTYIKEKGKIIHPITFSKKHDPSGEFIRRHVPELKNVPNSYIHEPWLYPGFFQLGYPSPIIDIYEAYKKDRRRTKKQSSSEQLEFDFD